MAIASGRSSAYDIELLFVSCDLGIGDLLNEVCRNGFTPLGLACKLNRADLVPLLLHKGAKPNVESIYLKKCPLHYACDHSDGNLDIVRMLLASGAEVGVCVCLTLISLNGVHLPEEMPSTLCLQLQ